MGAPCTISSDLSSRREVAARARVSVRTLDRLIATGKGPEIIRIGGQVFVREQHYEKWLTELSAVEATHPGAMDGEGAA